MSAAYHGILEGVRLASGTYLPLPAVALGSVEGVGLVTAPTVGALRAGRFFERVAGRYRAIREVFYRRRRPGGARWRHELAATAIALGPDGPVFLSIDPARAARVCAVPPGDFICEG